MSRKDSLGGGGVASKLVALDQLPESTLCTSSGWSPELGIKARYLGYDLFLSIWKTEIGSLCSGLQMVTTAP